MAKAESGRQKAEGRKRKAESGRQKAEGRKRKAESGRQKAEGRKQKAASPPRRAFAAFRLLPSAFIVVDLFERQNIRAHPRR